jgi:hypothetical protein
MEIDVGDSPMAERRRSSMLPTVRDGVSRVVLVSSLTLTGCVTMGRLSQREAILYARSNVCGANAADSVCVVRSVAPTDHGYVVVIDRRPPAGQDRLSVEVRGGMFADPHIRVTPMDTAARRP